MKKSEEMEKRARLRKGTWTTEEDHLLRECISKYGEGKWHLVPLRAGLNRCRKSCRLRWLNYLRPNIKRGNFSRAEVVLMKRMHKLLGNRWSLIAGRLPRRTANDVKNFWNTYIENKSRGHSQQETKTITKSNIVRPCPRSFPATGMLVELHDESQNYDKSKGKKTETSLLGRVNNGSHQIDDRHATSSSMHKGGTDNGDFIQWWNNLLEINVNGELGSTLVFPEEGTEIAIPTLPSSDPLLTHHQNYQCGFEEGSTLGFPGENIQQVPTMPSDPLLRDDENCQSGFVDALSLDDDNLWDIMQVNICTMNEECSTMQ